MELTRLPKERILKTYQRFSVPIPAPEPEPVVVQQLEFFYIGTQQRYINKLTDFFAFGYISSSTEQAMVTLKRLLKKTEDITIPNMIMVEAAVGAEHLAELHRFLSAHKILADMPLIVEATGLSKGDLAHFKSLPFIDDILFLNEFAGPILVQKVNFLKKVKQKWVHQPASCKVETTFPAFPDIRSFLKRTLDLLISSMLLVLLSPVFLLIALVIKFDSGGQVLSVSKRIGRGYRIFDFYKFRTIVPVDSETGHLSEEQALHKCGNAFRVTRAGLFLRKTGLDELPQLLNVFLGDMSLIGNRPLPLHEAAKLTTNEWAKRFLVPAGMTGLWQVAKRGKGVMSEEEIISLDNDYAEKPDLLYDFWIMANTPPAIKTNG